MVHTPEQGTVVTCDSTDFLGGLALPCLGVVGELLHQLTAYTHTGPVNAGGTCRKVANGLHGSAPVSGCEEQRATPTACNGTILQQRQDSLSGSTALAIVGHEEHVVCSIVAIHAFYGYVRFTGEKFILALGDDLVGQHLDRVQKVAAVGIVEVTLPHLGIQIHTAKHEPCGSLVQTAVVGVGRTFGTSLEQVLLHGTELGHQPMVHFLACGTGCSLGRNLGQERHVTESVGQHIVVESTNPAYLGSLVLAQCQAGFGLKIVVAIGYVGHQAVVHETQYLVLGTALVVTGVHQTTVGPPADGLIGAQTLQIVDITQQGALTCVVDIEIGTAVVTFHDQGSVTLHIHLLGIQRLHIGIDNLAVQVSHARCHCSGYEQSGCNI